MLIYAQYGGLHGVFELTHGGQQPFLASGAALASMELQVPREDTILPLWELTARLGLV